MFRGEKGLKLDISVHACFHHMVIFSCILFVSVSIDQVKFSNGRVFPMVSPEAYLKLEEKIYFHE